MRPGERERVLIDVAKGWLRASGVDREQQAELVVRSEVDGHVDDVPDRDADLQVTLRNKCKK